MRLKRVLDVFPRYATAGKHGKRVRLFSGDDLGLDQSGKKLYRLRDHVQDSEGKGFVFHFSGGL